MSSPHTPWPAADALARLVSDAQCGCAPAVDTMLVALRPPLLSFFTRRISRDQAEDLTQVALIRITRALPSIEPERADRFIITVACNLLRTAYAERSRGQGDDDDLGTNAGRGDMQHAVHSLDERRHTLGVDPLLIRP